MCNMSLVTLVRFNIQFCSQPTPTTTTLLPRSRGHVVRARLHNLHAFLLTAVMDACPELFCPEGRISPALTTSAATAVLGFGLGSRTRGAAPILSGSNGAVVVRGLSAGAPGAEQCAWIRRAVGALPTAPSAAIDLLRGLLTCDTWTLLSVGELALKEALPKVVYSCFLPKVIAQSFFFFFTLG